MVVYQVLQKVFQYQHIINQWKFRLETFLFCNTSNWKRTYCQSNRCKNGSEFKRLFDIGIYPLKNPKCYDLLWVNIDKLHVISDDLLNLAYDKWIKKRYLLSKT